MLRPIPDLDMYGWEVITIPQDRGGIGMRVTGLGRPMLVRIGLRRAITAIVITGDTGAAKHLESELLTCGL